MAPLHMFLMPRVQLSPPRPKSFNCLLLALRWRRWYHRKLLAKGGAGRTYGPMDAVLFIEDLEGIEVWFIARDEDGKPQGLAIDEVEEATLPLHNLVEAQQYAAGASPSEPLKAVLFDRLRTTPTFKRSLLVGGTGK